MSWLSNLFGGSNNGQFNSYLPAMSPEAQELYNLGLADYKGGFPELDTLFNTNFGNFRQNLAETMQTKRGLGAYSTPEVSQLANAYATGQAELGGQKLTAKQNLYNALRGLVRQPVTTFQQPQAGFGQQALEFAVPIASTVLSSYLGGANPMNKMMTEYIQSLIKPDPIYSRFNPQDSNFVRK